MTVNELIEELQALTPEQRELPVWVYSLNDAACPADEVEAREELATLPNTRYYRPARVQISSR